MAGWIFDTRWGRFAIVPRSGRWTAMFENAALGSYHSAAAALDDLIGGHTNSLPAGLDSSRMGLPPDLAEWEKISGWSSISAIEPAR
jgi:hypothetical protein